MPRVIEVIETTVSRGKGTESDMCRSVLQYHTADGEFLAENDPCAGKVDKCGDCVYKKLVEYEIDMKETLQRIKKTKEDK